jgi:hypothetical protein
MGEKTVWMLEVVGATGHKRGLLDPHTHTALEHEKLVEKATEKAFTLGRSRFVREGCTKVTQCMIGA